MRYILIDGFVDEVSFDYNIECKDQTCTEYEGNIPEGYTSLVDWAENANIRAYRIEDGNLVFDSNKNASLIALWASEEGLSNSRVCTSYSDTLIVGNKVTITPSAINTLDALSVTFEREFQTIPVVTLTPERELTSFYVSDITTTGMNINLISDNTDPVDVNYIVIGKK